MDFRKDSKLNTNNSIYPFNRCGLAGLLDLQTPEWQELFDLLEKEQEQFLSLEHKFRSPEYPWPRDPLHTWSRVWEYPYVYHHLKLWRGKFDTIPLVVDFGSGVTFFPFSVARLGYHVICYDVDIVSERDTVKARQYIPHGPGSVDFRLANGSQSTFSDGEADIIYSISVLEHIPDFENTLLEIARIIKPGGLLVLTFDLDLRGDAEISIDKFKTINNLIHKYFTDVYPDRTIHPADLLTSASGPFAHKPSVGFAKLKFILKQHIIKPILGRKPSPMLPFYLAVQGLVMQRL